VALLLSTGASSEALRRRIESSFGQYQNLKRIRETEADLHALEASLEKLRGYAAPCGDFQRIGRYRRARQEVEARRQALGRGRRGERTVAEAEPGRLILVRRSGAPTLAMVLGVHSIRGHRVLVDALLPHGVTVRVKSGVIKRIFWATPPLARCRPRPHARQSASTGPGGARARPRGARARPRAAGFATWPPSSSVCRSPSWSTTSAPRGPRRPLAAIECHRCPWGATARCDREWRSSRPLPNGSAYGGGSWSICVTPTGRSSCGVVEVLEQFGAVRERKLESKDGSSPASATTTKLLVAEIVAHGAFNDVSGPEAAAICSALLEEARSGDPGTARVFLRKRQSSRGSSSSSCVSPTPCTRPSGRAICACR